MPTELVTDLVGTSLAPVDAPRAFLVVHVDLPDRGSTVIDLHDGVDVTFGRSRGAVVTVDHASVSRLHARVRRTGDVIELEDLGSRNGTRVNGDKIEGVRRLVRGDEIALGPIQAVVNVTSGLRSHPAIVDADAGEARLVAEIDRAVRYRRPVLVAMLRITHDAGLELIARSLRAMDLLAEQAGDEYLLIMPELDRTTGKPALARLLDAARGVGAEPKAVSLVAPEDGTSALNLVAMLRTALRTGTSRRATTAPTVITGPIVIDPAMRKLYAMVERIADASMTVLILGETGVGKELVDRGCCTSTRGGARNGRSIKLNCAALTEALLESELFGHERGAFTGAARRKRRSASSRLADGGTLFLDEIGEMPPALQAKLLRVLRAKREFDARRRQSPSCAVDVRIVCCHQPRPRRRGGAPGGSAQDLLYRRRRVRARSCCRRCAIAPDRDHAAGRALRAARRRQPGPGRAGVHRRRARRADQLRLARQRARAAERGRTRAGPVRRPDPRRRPARSRPRREPGAAGVPARRGRRRARADRRRRAHRDRRSAGRRGRQPDPGGAPAGACRGAR
jgi:two-component system response regulator AtoC